MAVDISVIGHKLQQNADYGYRVDKVKQNLQIKVHNPSIDWETHNFVVSTRSPAAFPSAVGGQCIVWIL